MRETLEEIKEQHWDSEVPIVIYDKDFNVVWVNGYIESRRKVFNPERSGVLRMLDIEDVKSLLEKKKIIKIKLAPIADIGGEALMIQYDDGFIVAIFESVISTQTIYKPFVLSGAELVANEQREIVEKLMITTTAAEALVSSDSPDVERLFEETRRSSYRALRGAQNKEQLSEYFSGTLEMKRESCDICSVVEALCSSASDVLSQRTNISTKIPDEAVISTIDLRFFERAFLNVLLNAIKYTRDGNRVVVTVKETKSFITISVKDRGAGIKKENLGSVCDAFFSCEPNDDGGVRTGLGLGLTIASIFCETHGGSLIINSEFAKGTNVVMSIKKEETNEPCFEASTAKYITNKFSPVYVELNELCDIPR